MAEAFGKVYLSKKYDCYSAGTETKPHINQDALRIIKEHFECRPFNQLGTSPDMLIRSDLTEQKTNKL